MQDDELARIEEVVDRVFGEISHQFTGSRDDPLELARVHEVAVEQAEAILHEEGFTQFDQWITLSVSRRWKEWTASLQAG
ncbi:MAG: hypothetical protein WC107_01710 [Patescibacteria group bacterium]